MTYFYPCTTPSPTQAGNPIYFSWPHFLHGDPQLWEAIDGLQAPDRERDAFRYSCYSYCIISCYYSYLSYYIISCSYSCIFSCSYSCIFSRSYSYCIISYSYSSISSPSPPDLTWSLTGARPSLPGPCSSSTCWWRGASSPGWPMSPRRWPVGHSPWRHPGHAALHDPRGRSAGAQPVCPRPSDHADHHGGQSEESDDVDRIPGGLPVHGTGGLSMAPVLCQEEVLIILSRFLIFGPFPN